jgi:hypothetical protein
MAQEIILRPNPRLQPTPKAPGANQENAILCFRLNRRLDAGGRQLKRHRWATLGVPVGNVEIGYFRDFNASNTILIAGDKEGLERLLAEIQIFITGSSKSIILSSLQFISSSIKLHLILDLNLIQSRIIQIEPRLFHWQSNEQGWDEVIEKINLLLKTKNSHQYIENGIDPIIVQISYDEYSLEWWMRTKNKKH